MSSADVEGRDRFVADDELRPQSQGAGDADALALSPGKFVRVALAGGFVEAYGAQQFGDLRAQVELRSTGQPRAAVPT